MIYDLICFYAILLVLHLLLLFKKYLELIAIFYLLVLNYLFITIYTLLFILIYIYCYVYLSTLFYLLYILGFTYVTYAIYLYLVSAILMLHFIIIDACTIYFVIVLPYFINMVFRWLLRVYVYYLYTAYKVSLVGDLGFVYYQYNT